MAGGWSLSAQITVAIDLYSLPLVVFAILPSVRLRSAHHLLLYALLWGFVALSQPQSLRAEGQGGTLLRLPEDYFPQLQTILDNALHESPRMLLARLDLDAAVGDLAQARAGLYPSVGSTSRLVRTSDIRRDQPGSAQATKTYYDISLSQPLFHWGERRNNARIGGIRAAIAERNYAEGYRLLAREIRQGYLSLISVKAQVVGARFAREQAEVALRAAEERVKAGMITESELFGPQVALERTQLSEASAESEFIATCEHFEFLTGAVAPSQEELPEELPKIEPEPASTASLLADFLAVPAPSTPNLDLLGQEVEVARLTYKNQKTRLRPKVNFVLGITQDEQSYKINSGERYGVTSRYVGIQVSWPIFDGWATRGAVRSSLARLRSAEARYAQARSSASRQARAAARSLELAQRQMQINDQLLDVSQDSLRLRKEDLIAGRITQEAFAQAQASYYSDRVSANTARLNYFMAQIDFATAVNRDPVMQRVDAPSYHPLP